MTAYSLTGLAGMGTVISEESSKQSGLFQSALPGTDSSDAFLMDLFGASRTITISGKFVQGDSGYATIALFIAALDGLINGSQSAKSFVSGKSGVTYTVLVDNVTWSSEEGGVNLVEYTISMIEGGV